MAVEAKNLLAQKAGVINSPLRPDAYLPGDLRKSIRKNSDHLMLTVAQLLADEVCHQTGRKGCEHTDYLLSFSLYIHSCTTINSRSAYM